MEKGNYSFMILRWGIVLLLVGIAIIGGVNYFILEQHYNLTAKQKDFLLQKDKIIIGGPLNQPLLEYRGKDGKIEGFCVDLLKAVGKELGIEIEFREMPWNKAFQALKKGEIDAIDGVNYNYIGADNYELSRPYLFNPTKILVLKNQRQIRSLSDLSNKKVGVCSKIFETLNFNKSKKIDFLRLESYQQGIEMLMQGGINAYLDDSLSLIYILQQKNIKEKCKLITVNLESPGYCLAVKKGNKDLLALLNTGLFCLEQKGIKREIEGRWLGNLSAEKNPLYFSYSRNFLSILVFLFGSIFFYYWNKSLQEEIRQKNNQLEENNRKLILLSSISTALSQSLKLETVLASVLAQLVKSLELTGGAISWQKGFSSELIIFNSSSASKELLSLLSEQFWQEKLLEITKEQSEHLHKVSLEHCCGSLDCCYLGFPLKSNEKFLGIMGLLDEKNQSSVRRI